MSVNNTSRSPASGSSPSNSSSSTNPKRKRAETIIDELRTSGPSRVPRPDHLSAKKLGDQEVEELLVQFVAEKLAYAHLSAQIDNPTRQSIETMSKAWEEAAETIIEAVRRVDRDNPPSSFWEMQKR